jgi:hypothetical protein
LEATADTATVWVGALNENFNPAQVTLTVNQTAEPLGIWQQLQSEDGDRRVNFQRATLKHRTPDTHGGGSDRVNTSLTKAC